jgi:hypothetical protein
MKRVANANGSVVEVLEGRMMMSASPLAISQVAVGNQVELRIVGAGKNNHITLKQTDGGLVAGNNGVTQTILGQFADIKIFGGAGNDSIVVDPSVTTNCFLYGGTGKNLLQAGSGNDTLVCIGSTADTLVGGSGNDSFWTDAKTTEKVTGLRSDEIAGGNVHRVNAFYTGPSNIKTTKTGAKARASAVFPEPITTNGSTWQDFSSNPLFSSAGPSENDVVQGQVGDCFFLSVLSSVAKVDANKIRQSILDMGDGTYLVQFSKGTSNAFVHIDGQLPVLSNGRLDYAGLGAQGSTWVAIMEKAFAVFHGTTSSYASIDGGWMDSSYAAFGCSATSYFGGSGAANMMATLAGELALGESVTYATNSTVATGAPLIGGHAYTVDAVNIDSHGNPVSLRLRNPWGVDGAGNDGNNDGYVTVTADQAYASMVGSVSAFA